MFVSGSFARIQAALPRSSPEDKCPVHEGSNVPKLSYIATKHVLPPAFDRFFIRRRHWCEERCYKQKSMHMLTWQIRLWIKADSKHKTTSIQTDVFIDAMIKYRQNDEALSNDMFFVELKNVGGKWQIIIRNKIQVPS